METNSFYWDMETYKFVSTALWTFHFDRIIHICWSNKYGPGRISGVEVEREQGERNEGYKKSCVLRKARGVKGKKDERRNGSTKLNFIRKKTKGDIERKR